MIRLLIIVVKIVHRRSLISDSFQNPGLHQHANGKLATNAKSKIELNWSAASVLSNRSGRTHRNLSSLMNASKPPSLKGSPKPSSSYSFITGDPAGRLGDENKVGRSRGTKRRLTYLTDEDCF